MESEFDGLLSRSSSWAFRNWVTVGKKAVFRLLLVIMLERTAFYSIVMTSSLYFNDYLHFPSWATALMATPLIASVYVLAPLFGWLSDRKFGYFPILSSAFAMYVVGTIPICYTAFRTTHHYNDDDLNYLRALYLVGLSIIVLCASAVRATLLPYMLEQLGDGSETHSVIAGLITTSYFAVNVGAIAAGLGGGYLWKEPGPYNTSHYTGLFWSYLLAPPCLFVSFLLLVLWRNQYRSHSVTGSAEYNPSIRNIFATGCGCYRSQPMPFHYDPKELPIKNREEENKDRLDEHRQRLGVLVPVLSTLVIFYTIQGQIWQGLADQALHMDLVYDQQRSGPMELNTSLISNYCTIDSTNNEYLIPPTVLRAVDALFVILMLPIVWWFIPSMYVRCRQRELTMLDRVLIGMVLTALGCIGTLGVEVTRIRCGQFHHICLKVYQNALLIVYSTVSPLTQIPQRVLVGMGEAFTGIAAREFVLSRTPREFRCTAFGSLYLVNGLSFFAGGLLLFVMNDLHCYYKDTNPARAMSISSLLDTERSSTTWVYYVVLAVLMAVGCFIFHLIKRRHRDVLRRARAHIHGGQRL